MSAKKYGSLAVLSLFGMTLTLFGSVASMFGAFIIVFANGSSVSMAVKDYCDKKPTPVVQQAAAVAVASTL
jgi:hypothetical protein